jgi:hypothetical protein
MTTTVSLNYDSITFQSQYLNTSNTGLDLTLSINCGVETTNMLDALIPTINNTTNSITIPVASIISAASILTDGVYNIKLKIYTTDTNIEQACIYIGTTSRCKAVELYNKTTDLKLKLKLETLLFALENATLCDTCSCTKMCTIYNELLTLINSTTITTTNVSTDCGC